MSLSSLADKVCPPVCRPLLDRVQSSPIGKRIAGGAFWSIVGNGFGKAFTFVAMILVARILGKETFGEFGLIRSTATMFVAFSGFGMGLTATKYIAELLHTDKERTGRIIGLSYVFTLFSSLIVAIIFYMLAPWLCETQLNKPHLTNVMQLGAVLLFLTTFMGTQVSVMTGFQDFRGLAIATFIGGVTMLPIYVTGAYCWGLQGVVIGTIFAAGLNLLINSAFIYRNTRKNQIRYAFRQVYKELPVLWKSNIPLVLASIIFSFAFWFCQLMLASQPNGMAELGIYYAVVNFQAIMFFLPQQLYPVLLSTLSESNGTNKISRYWKIVRQGWFLNVFVTLLVMVPFLVTPKWFMGLNGIEFVGSWRILLIGALGTFINSVTSFAFYILVSRGHNWQHFVFSAISLSCFCLITVILLQYQIGAASIIWGYSFSQILYIGLALTVCRNKPC